MKNIKSESSLIVSATRVEKQNILLNLIEAHKRICANATAQDVYAIRQLTRIILRLLKQLGDGLVYLGPEDCGNRCDEPPNHLGNPD